MNPIDKILTLKAHIARHDREIVELRLASKGPSFGNRSRQIATLQARISDMKNNILHECELLLEKERRN